MCLVVIDGNIFSGSYDGVIKVSLACLIEMEAIQCLLCWLGAKNQSTKVSF